MILVFGHNEQQQMDCDEAVSVDGGYAQGPAISCQSSYAATNCEQAAVW